MKKMKSLKLLLCAFALFPIFSLTNTSAQIFSKGDVDINLGLGFGSTWAVYGTVGLPAVSGSFDLGIKDELGPGNLGVGGFIGYTTRKWDYLEGNSRYSFFLVGTRGTYHYQFVDKLDTYGGVVLGLRFTTIKVDYESTLIDSYTDNDTDILAGLFVGAKYYFSNNIAVFGELGYSTTVMILGITLKI